MAETGRSAIWADVMNWTFDEAEEQEARGRGEQAVFSGLALGEFRERLGFD